MPLTAIADSPTAPVPDPERSDTTHSADGRMVSEAEYWRDCYQLRYESPKTVLPPIEQSESGSLSGPGSGSASVSS